MTRKAFNTLAVFGVVTGRLLDTRPGAFAEIHEVMDHFYPGIMTIGMAAMLHNGQKIVEQQVPRVKDFPFPETDNPVAALPEYNAKLVEAFGPTIEIDGPAEYTDGQVRQAFDEFLTKK